MDYLFNFSILLLIINFIFAVLNMGTFAGELRFDKDGNQDIENGIIF